jgi:DNA-binding transcriptional regulator YhcF (GntR family)
MSTMSSPPSPPKQRFRSLPPYQRAAADLRRQILSGHLTPGEQLPTVRSLQQRYAIANMTVRAALHVLRAEGLVDIVHGKGTFVVEPLPQQTQGVDVEMADADRVEYLEETLRDVLSHIRPQGHPSWELNTCLVTNEQVERWWSTLGITPRWAASERACRPLGRS